MMIPTIKEIIAVLEKSAVIINAGTYSPDGMLVDDSTIFNYCNDCGNVDYMPHSDDCEVVSALNDTHEMIERLTGLLK